MENHIGRDQARTESGDRATRKSWIRPAVQEMSAGSAEDAKGTKSDAINPS
jgi:hypothetical protein